MNGYLLATNEKEKNCLDISSFILAFVSYCQYVTSSDLLRIMRKCLDHHHFSIFSTASFSLQFKDCLSVDWFSLLLLLFFFFFLFFNESLSLSERASIDLQSCFLFSSFFSLCSAKINGY